MATLQITECSDLARDAQGRILQAVDLSKVITQQTITYTATNPSAALDQKTLFVRVVANGADAHINIGTAPISTVDNTRCVEDVAEYFAVRDKTDTTTYKISAYDGVT